MPQSTRELNQHHWTGGLMIRRSLVRVRSMPFAQRHGYRRNDQLFDRTIASAIPSSAASGEPATQVVHPG
jgi:hypothetical protein